MGSRLRRAAHPALLAVTALTPLPGAADDRGRPSEAWIERARSTVAFSIGAFDAEHAGQRALEAGVQYRPGFGGRVLQPLVGATRTSAGAVNAYAGLALEVSAGRHLSLRGSFAPGYYTPGGAGKDLGSALEFRSGLEVAVRLHRGWRAAIELYHLSNAGIGRINPGQESLVLTVGVPVGGSRAARSP